ncbi:hypothetical protein KIPB_011437, partial [Kipferlia bialata]
GSVSVVPVPHPRSRSRAGSVSRTSTHRPGTTGRSGSGSGPRQTRSKPLQSVYGQSYNKRSYTYKGIDKPLEPYSSTSYRSQNPIASYKAKGDKNQSQIRFGPRETKPMTTTYRSAYKGIGCVPVGFGNAAVVASYTRFAHRND